MFFEREMIKVNGEWKLERFGLVPHHSTIVATTGKLRGLGLLEGSCFFPTSLSVFNFASASRLTPRSFYKTLNGSCARLR